MHRVARSLALTAFLVGLTTTHAAAQNAELPLCPDASESVAASPPALVRRGLSYELSIERTNPATAVVLQTTFVPAADAADTNSTTETFDGAANTTIDLVRAAPLKNGTLDLEVSWVQDVGTEAACRGYDNHRGIPVIGPNAKAGDPELARFDGRYRVSYRTDPERPTWTARPRCDVFGCTTDVRSTAHLRGTFRWSDEDDAYVLRQTAVIGYCKIEYGDGRPAKWRIYVDRTIKLRISATRDGRATRLVGSDRQEQYAPSDDADLCDASRTTIQRVTVRRR